MCALISYHICYSVMLLICIAHWYLPLPQLWKSHFGPHPRHDKKWQNFKVLLLESLASFFFLNLHIKGYIWRNFHASVRMWSIFPLIACTIKKLLPLKMIWKEKIPFDDINITSFYLARGNLYIIIMYRRLRCKEI